MDNAEEAVANVRTIAGFGLGTKRLDNELIREAFITGSGMTVGIALSFFADELADEERRLQFIMACYDAVSACTPDAPEEGGE